MTAFVIDLLVITIFSFSCGVFVAKQDYIWATVMLILIVVNIFCACLNYKTR